MFSILALNGKGKKIKFFLDVNSKQDVIEYVKKKNFVLIELKEIFYNPYANKKVKKNQLLIFTQLAARLFSSKLPIKEVFEILQNEITDKKLLTVIDDILLSLKRGQKLSDSLSKYPKIFPPIYVVMVQSGEETNHLGKTFSQLYEFYNFTYKNSRQFFSLLIYPTIIVIFASLLILGSIFFLIPQFLELYQSLNIQIPFITLFALKLGKILLYTIPIFSFAFLIYYLYWRILKKNKFLFVNYLKNKIPILKSVLIETRRIYLAFAIYILLNNKIPILNILEILLQSLPEERELLKIKKMIEQGNSIGKAFKSTDIFSNSMSHLIAGEEKTGKLSDTFFTISTFYQEKLEIKMKVLQALVQPVTILILGGIIGFIVIAFFLPIFNMVKVF